MDPNSCHQLWSQWIFTIREIRHVPRKDVECNVARWLSQGFGHAGAYKVKRQARGWEIRAVIEGKPAHDPAYVASVRRAFRDHFVARGWGQLGAVGEVSVRILAGDRQDGRPPAQWISITQPARLIGGDE